MKAKFKVGDKVCFMNEPGFVIAKVRADGLFSLEGTRLLSGSIHSFYRLMNLNLR